MARILVASEDMACAEILAAELGGQGHAITVASSGYEAHQRALAEQPEIVFLDIPLQVFNGYEVCRMLRDDPEIPKNLPIICLTTPDVKDRLMEKAGFTEAIPKQHEAWEIQEVLSRHLVAIASESPR